MNSNHCQLFTILIGFRTASPKKYGLPLMFTGLDVAVILENLQ